MRLTASFVTTVAAIGFTVSGPASAQDVEGPDCGTFVLTQDEPRHHFRDHGDDGVGAGDQQVIRAHLLNEEGTRIGTQNYIAIMMPSDDDGQHSVIGIVFEEFPNGALTSIALAHLADPEGSSQPPVHQVQRPVTGGTGAFAHASGVITANTRDDGVRELTFDLICPS